MGRWISGFIVPDGYELYGTEARVENGKRIVATNNCLWLTNIDHGRRHQPLQLMTMSDNLKYSKHKSIIEQGYQKYDNFDAIEVPYTDSIPSDYDKIMGVPITFLDKYDPEQFEIIALGTSKEHYTPSKIYKGLETHKRNGKITKGAPINSTLAIKVDTPPAKGEYYTDESGNIYIQPFARILIRFRR